MIIFAIPQKNSSALVDIVSLVIIGEVKFIPCG